MEKVPSGNKRIVFVDFGQAGGPTLHESLRVFGFLKQTLAFEKDRLAPLSFGKNKKKRFSASKRKSGKKKKRKERGKVVSNP
ncbi:hypothetical protein HY994_06660 [Candidatus Micrarchaeota archaeon]|nr:hypothetical protein [Candidatus Micrarchaeota archaeon]